MSHEITIRADGSAEAAFAKVAAWHELGVVVDHAMTSMEAKKAAQLDWRVETRPPLVCNLGDRGYKTATRKLAVVRTDIDEVLGVVSKNYQIIQNAEAFQFMDKLVEDEEIKYEAVFSLYGGRIVVLVARMPGLDYITESDAALRHILLSTSHDGSSSVRFGPTSLRVVCANNYRLALSKGGIETWSNGDLAVSHRGNVPSKLQRAREIISGVNRQFDDYIMQARQLAHVRWTDEQFSAFLDIMCPRIPQTDPDYTEARARAIEGTGNNITWLYYNHEWQSDPTIRQTAWAAVNAVVQHIDYLPRRGATPRQRAEARFNVVLYGPGRDMKQRAFVAAQRISQLAT